jgi:hypothetical protein
VVYAGGAKGACDELIEQDSTRLAAALIQDIKRQIQDVSWISWGASATSKVGAKSSTIWVGSLWRSIDHHIAQAFEQCEVHLASAQIATFKLVNHPAAALARAMLEQQRVRLSSWTQQRSLLMSEDEYQRWRAYVSSGVDLHNQTVTLLQQDQLSAALIAKSAPSGVAEIAASCLGSLLLQGQIGKEQAIHVVSLIADFVGLSKLALAMPAHIRPAWDKVNGFFNGLQPGMPSWELPLLFPRCFLLPASLLETARGDDHLKAISESNAMRVADDYERLAASMQFAPVLLECVSTDVPQLPLSISQSYRTAKAALLASAALLRAVCRRQMIELDDEKSHEVELAELTEADLQYPTDGDPIKTSTFDFSKLANRPTVEYESGYRGEFSVSDPQFCEVCFRCAGRRKFCSLHLNTGGKSRHEIREAQQFFPQYKNAMLTLRKKLSNIQNGSSSQASFFDEPFSSFDIPPTFEGMQKQTLELLARQAAQAQWGVETDKLQDAKQRLEQVAATIETKILNVSLTPPIVWEACVFAITSLEALRVELETLRSLVDLLLDPQDINLEHRGLLGDELRLFEAAYMADILCQVAAICTNATEITQLPEDLRRDFYTKWLNGYSPRHSLGHRPNTEARDPAYIQSNFDKSAFSPTSLWAHFARLAAWRKAEKLPPVRKPRLRRLDRDVVTSLRKSGVSMEEIAEQLGTTSEGVRFAISRWDAKSAT